MAKQTGIIKLKGTIGGISFYKTGDGHLAREKGGVDKNRIQNDPAFQRTRENGSEFGRAGKGGKVLRNAIRVLLQNAKDKRVVSRLTKDLLAIVKTDTTNDRGLRTIQDGNLSLLERFEFNLNGKLGATLFAVFTNSFDRVTGDATLNIAAFSPTLRIAAPTGTTHFKVVMGATELDFANETSTFENDETAILPYTAADTLPIALTSTITANSILPVVQVLGIEFYQEVNGQMYALKNGAYNALAVITIDTP
jgi:GGDEF domain-containing protein